ncbi:SDR family oxidoreductase [Nocardioides limicola]|uniref:SDR family oxidoreductase n=1 Tax=Nocardioides limicola TaxID=2803368 RepID=UPI00193B6DCE|nr:SDR family oxidoreductase [Nocardioides sp. DJM-14]
MRHLVTGAGSGIGRALVDLLHGRGDDLLLWARDAERAEVLAGRHPGADILVGDLADPVALEQVLSTLELPARLDSLVHCAGVVDLAPVEDLTAADLIHQVAVNAVAPALISRACLPALRAAQGSVVFVNSGAGLHAHPHWSAYAASKHAVKAIADALRAEEQQQGVRVTSVYPGRVATPMQQKVHEQEERDYDASAWVQPGTVAAQILAVLDLPDDAVVPEIQIRPR